MREGKQNQKNEGWKLGEGSDLDLELELGDIAMLG